MKRTHTAQSEVAEILELFSFYREGPEALRGEMKEAAHIGHLDTGDFFYHASQSCPHFALVGRGQLRVFKEGGNGRQITLYHVHEGETCMVNLVCAILNRTAPATAQVDQPVDALLIPAAKLRSWLHTYDVIRSYVIETLSERLVDTMELIEEVAFSKMDARLAAFLQKRFKREHGVGHREITITHEEIAEELGSAREVISRLLENFQRKGAIEISRGHIVLRDEGKLNSL